MKPFPLYALLTTIALSFAAPEAHAQETRSEWIDIEVGKSIVIETPKNATAVAVTDPTVAEPVPLASPNKIMIQGKQVGTTDLIIQQAGGAPFYRYEITVSRDLTDLVRRIDDIVEGAPPSTYALRDRIVVEGPVDDLETLERVAQMATVYDEDFVNLMTVRGDHQVQLEVVFAEVSRTQLRELGLNVLYGNQDAAVGLTSPGSNTGNIVQFGELESTINGGIIPAAAAGTFQLLGFASDLDFGAILSVLDDNRLSKILAQPTLVALSGQQAEFLAGGEIPVPAPSGAGAISITYKEYGVKLVFIPTVLAGNVVDMRVQVEVSEPDFSTGTRLTGIEVPGFISRKGKSHLRIESGMTFAMAGLLNEQTVWSRAQVPLLGDIPVLGALFRYVRHQREETELVIFVTPRLVRPLGPGEVPAPPGTTEDTNPNDLELFLLGMDHRPGSRTADPTPSGPVGLER